MIIQVVIGKYKETFSPLRNISPGNFPIQGILGKRRKIDPTTTRIRPKKRSAFPKPSNEFIVFNTSLRVLQKIIF
jgi:hypothetical protein